MRPTSTGGKLLGVPPTAGQATACGTISKPRSIRPTRCRTSCSTRSRWHGRLLVADPHPAEQARSRAMLEAAATDFRSLEMVICGNLAEQFLAAVGKARKAHPVSTRTLTKSLGSR
jgi:hypothetical protein